VLCTQRRLSTRCLKTVFGTIEIVRMGYSHAGQQHLSLECSAGFAWACVLLRVAKTLVQAAVQGTFQESIDGIADLTGLPVSKRSLEDLLVDAARD
jgi:hypothetical protein